MRRFVKRRKYGHQSFEQMVAQAALPAPKSTALRTMSNVRVNHVMSVKRRQLIHQKRKRMPSKACSGNESEPMDIVGYVSHPWGATQSCDHDID